MKITNFISSPVKLHNAVTFQILHCVIKFYEKMTDKAYPNIIPYEPMNNLDAINKRSLSQVKHLSIL